MPKHCNVKVMRVGPKWTMMKMRKQVIKQNWEVKAFAGEKKVERVKKEPLERTSLEDIGANSTECVG